MYVDHLQAENLVIAPGAAHRVGTARRPPLESTFQGRPKSTVSVTSRSSTAKSWPPWQASRHSPATTVRSAVECGALVDSPCAGVKPSSRVMDRVVTRVVAEKRAAIEARGKSLTRLTADAVANDDALPAVVL
jgi:hypothetical protein